MKSDDLISRSALEAKAKTIYMEFDNVAVPTRVISIADLHLAPAVDAEPVRHAKWHYMRITRYNMPIDCRIRCSNCGAIFARLDGMNYRFCPNCGAKMRGDNDAAD